ncbi:MAG: asparagine synthase (glutamine-hydrolyzing) [Caulobacterales bacterium]
MCGIAGFQGRFAPELLDQMQAAIAHRGPDAVDTLYLAENGVGLAHRRLSILDLSPAGVQPMWSHDRRAVIVFNGEIYNFPELRAELSAKGAVFRSTGDTEVLLELYRREGEAAFGRLNGMFACAIWDLDKRELVLARDGFGVKPLYIAETPKGFLFASEIKAFLPEPSFSRDVDREGLALTLAYLWCPGPRTALKSVKKLGPGEMIVVKDAKIVRRRTFYTWLAGPVGESRFTDLDKTTADLRAHLGEAVRRQLIADVPVGAFLSGGLDSSAVVAFAQKALEQGQKLTCFTIAGDPSMVEEGFSDDLKYARLMAKHLKVDLVEVPAEATLLDHLPMMARQLDEPQGDTAPIYVSEIAKAARERGVTVLLSGAGGDDLFSGYRRHIAQGLENYWAWLPQPVRAGMGAAAGLLPTRKALLRRVRKAFEHAALSGDDRPPTYFHWLAPLEIERLVGARYDVAAPMRDSLRGLQPGVSPLGRMLHLDQRFFLIDHNLNYTDKLAMKHGIEVRVPFLDPDLARFAADIPDAWRVRDGHAKWIFKQAMRPMLPDDLIFRPKAGFGAPLRSLIQGKLKPFFDAALDPDAVKARGLFDPAAVASLRVREARGEIDAAYPLLTMAIAQVWSEAFAAPSAVPGNGRAA